MNQSSQPTPKIYSVSKLTREIKYLLEEKYEFVWISGEISNLRIPNSGHAYFTLKDNRAQISAVMFRGQLRQLAFDLDDGSTIVGMGRIAVYEPRGAYQVILEYVEPKGVGALQIAFEQLKRKLAEEDLFESVHKKPLPFLPLKIGVVTSASGAALHDILKIVYRRFPNLVVDVYPVHVQGDTASVEISKALALANKLNDADVIILARGGGSIEDLAAFNTEIVARSIFASKIPIVSGVGHETDFTIADLVADLRAPTPSAAAEMVVPVKDDLSARCTELTQRCMNATTMLIAKLRKENDQLRHRLVHPQKRIQELQLRLDDLEQRLTRTMENQHNWKNQRLNNTVKLLFNMNPKGYISNAHTKIDMLNYKLTNLIKKHIAKSRQTMEQWNTALNTLSPLAVLKRGYSITRSLPLGSIISHADDVSVGQSLEIILYQGVLETSVTGKQDEPEQ